MQPKKFVFWTNIQCFFLRLLREFENTTLVQHGCTHPGLSLESGLVCVACVGDERKKCKHASFDWFFFFVMSFLCFHSLWAFVSDSPVHLHTCHWCNMDLYTQGSHLKVVWCVQHVWFRRKKKENIRFSLFSLTFNIFCTAPPCTHTLLDDVTPISTFRALI